MSDKLQLNAEIREDVGKGASRRLRHQGVVPAIVYGAGKEPQTLSLQHNEVIKAAETEAFFSQILDLNIAGKKQPVVLKDIQRHAFKPKITHLDFLRIKASEAITMNIPLHFINEEDAPGVKEGGAISHAITEVEVKCLPANLPEYIAVDVANMKLDDIVHLSDLKLPEGVELTVFSHGDVEEHDQPVASLHMTRIAAEVEEAPVEEEVETESTETKEEASAE